MRWFSSVSSWAIAPGSKVPTRSNTSRRNAPGHTFSASLCVRFSVLRVADTQWALQRCCDASLKECARSRRRGAAHVVGAGAIEHLDALAYEIGCVLALYINSNENVAARAPN